MGKGLLIGYIVVSVVLTLFSYTQVDLNLTLSQAGIIQTLQKAFQQIGFFNRPLATVLYIALFGSLFFLQYICIDAITEKKLSIKEIWKIVFFVFCILFFSYPAAFSYDFFNYMFTAKTVLLYGQNPYEVTPLAFSGVDPWLTFMRWTHLPSAYTPLWIILTFVPYLAGLGYFVFVLFSLKLLVASFYLLACVMIYKIAEPSEKNYSLALFALNPLIIIESLVSAHNDIVMMALALVAFWFVHSGKTVNALGFLGLSIATKLMTIMLLPMLWIKDRRVMLTLMVIGLLAVILRREFLPWYLVWIVPFTALLPTKKWLQILVGAVSMGLLLRYAPYFYFGDYHVPTQTWRTVLFWVPILPSVLLVLWQQKKLNS